MAGRPKLACEVLSDRVIAARAAADGASVDLYASRKLSPGAVAPAFAETNIREPEALRSAITSALAGMGDRSREIVAILPDATIRVMLLDFDSLPDRKDDALVLVKHRLRKSLPFEVDDAALSYHLQRHQGKVSAVIAVAPRSTIAEYEQAFRDSGFNPGVVLPSSLAALGALHGEVPTLLVKVDAASTTIAILDKDQLLLLRTLDTPHDVTIPAAKIAEQVYPSLVFFEDSYGARIQRVVLAGIFPPDLPAELQAQTGLVPEELYVNVAGDGLSSDAGPRSLLAAVTGALAGA